MRSVPDQAVSNLRGESRAAITICKAGNDYPYSVRFSTTIHCHALSDLLMIDGMAGQKWLNSLIT